ncbi:uncharacterized protein LOC131680446 [Topomyia yanbarensis]|uniref:uncharacterized protein LOC131680446 n=1 Tax=Topomyia yanbarensis TaxID=2498891 RepID=UPI00273B567F|nr:uncharacterized protein LOC131680446 [Topomyia yanbarensis]
MSNDRRIKSLKLRLRSILTSFNLIKSFVDEFEEEAHATEVPVRLENLVTLWADFNKLQAWNLLVEHFQDTARLKQSYIDALFEFPSIRRESATELHSLVERFEANVRVLQQLGEKTEFWDVLLIRMLSIRLDPTTRRDWEEYSSAQDTISFHDLTSFLQRRVTVLQNLQGKCTEVPPPSVPKKQPQRQFASHGATQTNYRKCLVCSENHPLYQCATFSKMSPDDKEREVRRHQLCRNCLRKGHFGKDCPCVSSCRKCRGRHHTQLCITDSSSSGNVKTSEHSAPKVSQSLPPNDQPTTSLSATVPETRSYASTRQQNTRVLLATAVVLVVDDHGSQHVARALLDSGSECCFMTESFAQLVKAKRKKFFVPIAGIGQSTTHAKHKLFSTIRSRISSYSATVEFLILSKVTVDIPYASVDISSWNFPPEIQLADPSFHDKNSVDLVIGAEVFFDLFKVTGRIALGDNLPTLVNSELGWVVSGRTSTCLPTTPVTAHVATVTDLHTLMEKFWVLEDDRSSHCHSVEEATCEEHFRQTVSRTTEGRYVVRLPIKTDVITNICDNRRVALRRFHLLEARLARNEELRQQYTEFLDEYLKLGHMQQIQEDDQPSSCYHLPHHAIIREDSASTKVRVVFDASCKTPNGPSLNEALMVGPIVQQDLRSIIMRSRKHRVMLIADIRQMYRQVLMDERYTPLQRIVWRPTPDVPINTYELKTITYGTASAPFLATRTLLQLANDERAAFAEAAEVLIHDFYVDDLFSGCNTVAETIALRRQLDTLLAKGGFELRKWASNEEEVLNDIPQNNRALQSSVDFNRDQCIKTLGLHWEPSSDMLRYKVKLPPPETNATLTKRIALSHIAQLFDPLGAANELRQLVRAKDHQQAIAQECSSTGIRWHFNPPKASHFGGLWEAAIYSAQKHFVRVLGTHNLPFDEMETLLAQIECCLNSRPIVPLSDDPTDYEPLTPGHFLTGSALKAVPDIDFNSVPYNRLRKWQQTQKIFQNIWNRWKTEYLTSLQRRTKWCDPPVQLTPNQLVILRDEATAPMQWITARITELHPGPDGVTRVVTVQTPTGRFTRPVSKICILPIAPPDLASTETAALQESSTQPIIAEYHPIVVPAKQ